MSTVASAEAATLFSAVNSTRVSSPSLSVSVNSGMLPPSVTRRTKMLGGMSVISPSGVMRSYSPKSRKAARSL